MSPAVSGYKSSWNNSDYNDMMKVITELTQQLTRYLLTQHVRAHRCIAVRPYTYRKYELTRCSAITEAALQGALFFCQKWKTGTGRQCFTYIIGLSSTTVTFQLMCNYVCYACIVLHRTSVSR